MKKLLSVALALVLALSVMSGFAWAEDYSDYTIRIYSNSNSTERVTWLLNAAKKAGFSISIDDNSVISGDTAAIQAANENKDGDLIFGLNETRWSSDITGAVVARAAGADLYENWTDVSGFLMADPRIVDHPKEIRCLTYAELRELSYMGATVLHEESIFPVHKAGIPTNIRNTNDPSHPGTMILDKPQEATGIITGIAGHKNFSLLSIEKAMLNSEKGFCRKVLSVLEDFDISIEHMPTGIDTVSVVVADSEIKNRQSEIIHRIRELCQPDHIDISTGIALIATVGIGMVRSPGTAARLFGGLHKAGVNVRMIDQGSSELNIIVGVDTQDFEKAVKAIYEAFNS